MSKICVYCGALYPVDFQNKKQHLWFHQKQLGENHGIKYQTTGDLLLEEYNHKGYYHRLGRINYNRSK